MIDRVQSADPAALRRVSWLLFASTLLAYSYFHAGGGWNQNVRFAMARAIVERGTVAIDEFLVYRPTGKPGGGGMERVPVLAGEVRLDGRTYVLAWRTAPNSATPAAPFPTVDPTDVSASGDLALQSGRLHPNKAPGGALVAVPAYALIHLVGRIAGLDPDDWWTMTVNAWLTSVLSVGLLSAVGSVLFFLLCLDLTGGAARASLATTLTFSFGTMYFAYATSLYEHNVITASLLGALWFLSRAGKAARTGPLSGAERRWSHGAMVNLGLAGACAGYAAITNYVMAVMVVFLGAYTLSVVRRRRDLAWFASGLFLPFLVICAYNLTAFGMVFTTNYSFMNPIFRASRAVAFGIFGLPDPEALLSLVGSPFRGLFFTSPFLLLGIPGLVVLHRDPERRPFVWLAVATSSFFLLFVSTMNEWHGGWSVGPRYLAPAMPFLALPAALAFLSRPRAAATLAAVSIAVNVLVVAVDIQPPVGVGAIADVPGKPRWVRNPVLEYALPLFLHDRPVSILEAQRQSALIAYETALASAGRTPDERTVLLDRAGRAIDEAIRSGAPAPLLPASGPDGSFGLELNPLSAITGPVSANPMGIYEGWMFRVFPPGSRQARWNSFNAGEFLFPESRWSLLPLLIAEFILCGLAFRAARRIDAGCA
ncbi:MAG: hypothetical protein WB493_14610 [Anaeromyxobacteraceae bacterium]